MSSTSEFLPQWASPPGETIADILAARGWTQAVLASRLGEPVHMVEALISGAIPITIGMARRLQEQVGASVAFWMARDVQYRQDVERIRRIEYEWMRSIPVAEMSRLGWLPAQIDQRTDHLLKFFDVASVPAWHRRYSDVLETVSFKTSASFESEAGAVVAWMRQGERVAAKTECKPWDPDALRRTLPTIRRLTKVGRPERFLPRLTAVMADCGVTVAILPAPHGCRASGATLWISDRKALLLLSARHLTDDHLWFTFYHECGHLLLHRETRAFIDNVVLDGAEEGSTPTREAQEEQANAFAVDVLLTENVLERLRTISPTYRTLLRLASTVGIAPGILVGQLQRMGRIGPDRLNRLKRRYRWVNGQLTSRERK